MGDLLENAPYFDLSDWSRVSFLDILSQAL
jgi:hypothetical protein